MQVFELGFQQPVFVDQVIELFGQLLVQGLIVRFPWAGWLPVPVGVDTTDRTAVLGRRPLRLENGAAREITASLLFHHTVTLTNCYATVNHRVQQTGGFRHTNSCLLVDRLTMSRRWGRSGYGSLRLFMMPAATCGAIDRRADGASVRGFPQVPMRRRELRGRPAAGHRIWREQLTRACTIVPVSLSGTGQRSGPVTHSTALGGMVIRNPNPPPPSRGRTQRSACWGTKGDGSTEIWSPATPGARRPGRPSSGCSEVGPE